MRDMVQVRRGQAQSYKGPEAKIGRSQFNRSHGLKMSFDASYLYPIMIDEVLPGDTFTCKVNGFCRIFSPLDAPVMDNITLDVFWFYCPTRILWTNWVGMHGEHTGAGAQDTTYTVPVMATGMTVDHDNVKTGHGLAAHLGLPEGLTSAGVTGVSALPFRMYNRVYSEWFRDQNLSVVETLNVDDGPDTIGTYIIQKSMKKHDYFTSCLPYTQKGTAVIIPITGSVPVTGIGKQSQVFDESSISAYESNLTNPTYTFGMQISEANTDSDDNLYIKGTAASSAYPAIFADMTGASTGIDVNALRQSIAIQRLLERDARGGTRYVELIKAHFGVTSPDFRLQRPEYLGGGKSFINISPVANTSATATQDQGELAGVGTGVLNGMGFAKSFTEHGYIMGLIRARADLTYFQGLDKLWTRSTRYDFYIPALANLGEQSVLNQEIWVSNSSSTDKAVFGYQERWAEYRMKASRLVGVFNPDVTGALSQWHLAEDFSSLPALNTAFMADSTPMARITTVDTEPDFLLDIWFDLKCARPMPVFSIPSLTNRF